ncbi:hypothetical protein EV121DRAFT_297231 [Schizophyllum commune]
MQEVPEKPAPSEKYSTPVAWTDVPDVGQTNEGSESLHIAAIKHKAFVLQRLANAEAIMSQRKKDMASLEGDRT